VRTDPLSAQLALALARDFNAREPHIEQWAPSGNHAMKERQSDRKNPQALHGGRSADHPASTLMVPSTEENMSWTRMNGGITQEDIILQQGR
jgi:hypothetical protein